jgi:hypothetical protein
MMAHLEGYLHWNNLASTTKAESPQRNKLICPNEGFISDLRLITFPQLRRLEAEKQEIVNFLANICTSQEVEVTNSMLALDQQFCLELMRANTQGRP